MSNPPHLRKRTVKTGGRGVATINTSRTGREDKSRSLEIEDELDCANPGYVGVSLGMTKNMGEYNSLKMGVHISLPCLPTDKAVQKTYRKASRMAAEFLDEEYENAMAEIEDEDDE